MYGYIQVYPLPAVVAGPSAPYAVITGGSSGIGREIANEVWCGINSTVVKAIMTTIRNGEFIAWLLLDAPRDEVNTIIINTIMNFSI